MDIFNLSVVVTLVLGLTQWIKERLALSGRPAEVLSFAIGAIFGGAYQYAVTQPVELQAWLTVVFVGLLMALVPSGIYKFVSQQADKVVSK